MLQGGRHVAAMVLGRRALVVGAKLVDVRVNLADKRVHRRIDERQEALAADSDQSRHEGEPRTVVGDRLHGAAEPEIRIKQRGLRQRHRLAGHAVVGILDEELANRIDLLEQR